jgi:hypothetical protein
MQKIIYKGPFNQPYIDSIQALVRGKEHISYSVKKWKGNMSVRVSGPKRSISRIEEDVLILAGIEGIDKYCKKKQAKL